MSWVRLCCPWLVSLLLLSAPVCAGMQDALSDGPDGATCYAFNVGVGGEWARKGGDWQDAAHQMFGARPYATASVPARFMGRTIQFDMTAMVKDWLLGKADVTKGVMISTIGAGKGILDVSSREHADMASRPTLTIEFADGSADLAFPFADTYLGCASVKSSGQENRIKLGSDYRGLLAFNLPSSVRERRVAKATLTLNLDKQYGGELTLGVFAASPPVSPDAIPRLGLAARYADEAQLAKDPGVYFAAGFESLSWAAEWSSFDPRSFASRISEDPERAFVPLKGSALKVHFKKGQNLALDLRYAFHEKLGFEPEEGYFRYYLRLGNNWSPDVDGGKLPGFAGTYGKAGWGMRKSSGKDGWSLRGSFGVMTSLSNSMAGVTPIGTYAYHADMESISGDSFHWPLSRLAGLQRNRWYCIEQYLKLNKPGQKDGVFRAWIDGRLVFERTDLRLRDVPDLKIESVWFNVYHGGVTPPPRDMDLYIDNVVIAKNYIGPMSPPRGR